MGNTPNNDSTKKLEQVLSGLGPAKIKKGLETFNRLAKSGDADKIKKQLENIDTQKVLNMFNNMDTDEIKAKLNNFDPDKINLDSYANDNDIWKKFKS